MLCSFIAAFTANTPPITWDPTRRVQTHDPAATRRRVAYRAQTPRARSRAAPGPKARVFWSRTRWRGDGSSASGPLLGDVEVVELVGEPPVRGEVGLAGRLEGLEGGRPARRSVAVLLLGAEVRRAQPVVVLGLGLQAAEHVLFGPSGHGARPPVLPDPLPAGDAVAAQQGGQEHSACGGRRQRDGWRRGWRPRDCTPPSSREVGRSPPDPQASATAGALTGGTRAKPRVLRCGRVRRRKCGRDAGNAPATPGPSIPRARLRLSRERTRATLQNR